MTDTGWVYNQNMAVKKRATKKKATVKRKVKPVSPTKKKLLEQIPYDEAMQMDRDTLIANYERIHKDKENGEHLPLEQIAKMLDRGYGLTEEEEYELNAQYEQEELPEGETGVDRVLSLVNKEYFSVENANEAHKILLAVKGEQGEEVLRGSLAIEEWQRIADTLGIEVKSGKKEEHYMEKVLVMEQSEVSEP